MVTIDKRNDEVTVEFKESTSFIDAVDLVMTGLEALVGHFIDTTGMEIEDKERLYDDIDSLFGKFLQKVFPDINPREFDLTDAAIVKAQDEIINDAHARGITFDEALREYEDKAKEYIDARKMS